MGLSGVSSDRECDSGVFGGVLDTGGFFPGVFTGEMSIGPTSTSQILTLFPFFVVSSSSSRRSSSRSMFSVVLKFSISIFSGVLGDLDILNVNATSLLCPKTVQIEGELRMRLGGSGILKSPTHV